MPEPCNPAPRPSLSVRRRLARRLTALRRDRRGGVAILFGLSIFPLMFAVGATIDYSRSAHTLAEMQRAVDSAAIAVARDGDRKTPAELRAIAEALLDFHMNSRTDVVVKARTVEIGTRNVRVALEADQRVSFVQLMRPGGVVPLSVEGRGAWGKRRIELALVLDNTGSMGSANKMTELKKAINGPGGMLDILASIQREPDMVKVAVVPFEVQVRAENSARNADWLSFNHSSTNFPASGGGSRVTRGLWDGCIADRDQPNDIDDIAPDTTRIATLYPGTVCRSAVLARMLPLTTNLSSIRTRVNTMSPGGNTNVTIGIQWGMAMLSNGEPHTQASPATDPDVKKFMIVLTDGDNTQNRFSTNGNQIDARTRLACTAAKNSAKQITVYTIRVINGDADLLRDCASSPDKFKNVNNASELGAVFRAIADEITNIRLTN